MFGLGGKKEDEKKELLLDLEEKLGTEAGRRELKEMVGERMQRIKTRLREGSSQDHFEDFGVLLHGYGSLLKVFARFGKR